MRVLQPVSMPGLALATALEEMRVLAQVSLEATDSTVEHLRQGERALQPLVMVLPLQQLI